MRPRSRFLRLALACSLFAAVLGAQADPDEYWMSVSLDPGARAIRGEQQITWTNRSGAPTEELRFHLYLNAFRDQRTTFMREAGPAFRAQWRAHDFGSIRLQSLIVERGSERVELSAQCKPISPDDGNPHDATVLLVPLPAAVGPDERIRIRTRFEALLPKAHRRTGWIPGGGIFAMQWFPKLGVLGEGGRWQCHQFHANTEFFSGFATYDVSVELPRSWVIGATGGLGTEIENAVPDRARKVVRFRQANVHDFAFVADPQFRVHRRTWQPTPAILARHETAQPVELLLLLHPEHDRGVQAARHFEAVECGLAFFGERFGPYPYPTLTIVDPGSDVFGRSYGGGMEYPTLITCGTRLFLHARELVPESVTVHEFGHQYWYGLSANDESEESWLDEGINSYSENRAQQLHYGSKVAPVHVTRFGLLPLAGVTAPMQPERGLLSLHHLPGMHRLPGDVGSALAGLRFRGRLIPDSPLLELLALQPTATQLREVSRDLHAFDRARMLAADNPDPLVLPAWKYASRTSYVTNSYSRPATLLVTLERLAGRTRWWDFLRAFHEQARFRHPTTAEFRGLLAERCGPAVADFFARASEPQAEFDYGVASVETSPGLATVTVRRYGNLRGDVRVRFRFVGRPDEWRTIPAAEPGPLWQFRFEDETNGAPWGRLVDVWVDPPAFDMAGEEMEARTGPVGVYLLDANLLNNAWRAAPDRQPARYRAIRALLQAQTMLTFAGFAG